MASMEGDDVLTRSVTGLVFVDCVTFSEASVGQKRELESHNNARKRREECCAMRYVRQPPGHVEPLL